MLNYYTSEGVQPRLWYQYDRAGCPTTTAIATTAVTSTITTFDHLAVTSLEGFTLTATRTVACSAAEEEPGFRSFDTFSVGAKDSEQHSTYTFGDWLVTPACQPARMLIKIWVSQQDHTQVYLGMFDGAAIAVEKLHLRCGALPVAATELQFDTKMLAKAAAKLGDMQVLSGRLKHASTLPISKIVSHRDTSKELDQPVNFFYTVQFKGFTSAINEEITEDEALRRCNRLERDYRRALKAECKAAAKIEAAANLQVMAGMKAAAKIQAKSEAMREVKAAAKIKATATKKTVPKKRKPKKRI